MTTSAPQQDRPPVPDPAVNEREQARKRLETKRKFRSNFVAYVLVNAFLVIAWAIGGRGYFWPGWALAAWGVFLLIDAYRIDLRAPITDADIDEEMRRHR